VTTPVLAFHAIEQADTVLAIDPARFERVVSCLKRRHFASITAAELLSYIDRFGRTPKRTVVFTFDDGYRSVRSAAYPILADAGFVATVYPVTGLLGETNQWDAGSRHAGLHIMSEADLIFLAAGGWEIGGHTHTHRRLVGMDPSSIEDELTQNARALEAGVGVTAKTFAYPFGAHDEATERAVSMHYRAAFGIGSAALRLDSPRLSLPRIEGWYLQTPRTARLLGGPLESAYLALRSTGRRIGEHR
jgi:peptidoglycan/xylan/chitin deacetylase (PgdA/CDA1 family)